MNYYNMNTKEITDDLEIAYFWIAEGHRVLSGWFYENCFFPYGD